MFLKTEKSLVWENDAEGEKDLFRRSREYFQQSFFVGQIRRLKNSVEEQCEIIEGARQFFGFFRRFHLVYNERKMQFFTCFFCVFDRLVCVRALRRIKYRRLFIFYFAEACARRERGQRGFFCVFIERQSE